MLVYLPVSLWAPGYTVRVHYSTYTSMTVGADSVEGTVTHLLGHHLVNYLADMTYSRFNYDVLNNLDNCKLAVS